MEHHKDTNKITVSNKTLHNIQMERMIQFGLHKSKGDVTSSIKEGIFIPERHQRKA